MPLNRSILCLKLNKWRDTQIYYLSKKKALLRHIARKWIKWSTINNFWEATCQIVCLAFLQVWAKSKLSSIHSVVLKQFYTLSKISRYIRMYSCSCTIYRAFLIKIFQCSPGTTLNRCRDFSSSLLNWQGTMSTSGNMLQQMATSFLGQKVDKERQLNSVWLILLFGHSPSFLKSITSSADKENQRNEAMAVTHSNFAPCLFLK